MDSVHPWYSTAAIMKSALNTNAKCCQLSSLGAQFLHWTTSSGCIGCWCEADKACCHERGSGHGVIAFDVNEIVIRTFSLLDEDKIWKSFIHLLVCWYQQAIGAVYNTPKQIHLIFLYQLTFGCFFLLSDCLVLEISDQTLRNIQDVPGGMCQTSGGCSLC
jgi:hypothetical protein